MSIKILIIDDEPNILKVATIRLSKAGYEVITANDGVKGLELASTAHPNLILLDLNLPELSGAEVCRLLKNNNELKHIPVIVLSASAEDIKDKALNIGADDFVIKPYSPAELLTKIGQLLTRDTHGDTPNNKDIETVINNTDAQVKELIPFFIQEKNKDLELLKQSLETGDYATIQRIGHNLRGSGTMFGIEQISQLGIKLESAGKDKNPRIIKPLVEQLSVIIVKIETLLLKR
ncbi:MAG: response regulator [Elusimicrobiota bacterium]